MQLVRDALRNMGKIVAACKIALLGASYREDVGDTRYSGSEVMVRKLTEMGAEMVVHDPYLKHWWEFEKQHEYPSPGHSLARFFRNQERLHELSMQPSLEAVLKGTDAVVFAVRHKAYLELEPERVRGDDRPPGRGCRLFRHTGRQEDQAVFRAGLRSEGAGARPREADQGRGPQPAQLKKIFRRPN